MTTSRITVEQVLDMISGDDVDIEMDMKIWDDYDDSDSECSERNMSKQLMDELAYSESETEEDKGNDEKNKCIYDADPLPHSFIN